MDDFSLDSLDLLAPTRAAIYARISLDKEGDEKAVTRQREDARRLIRERGWTLVGEYVDNSLSASKRGVVRPEYERLMMDYRRGAIDAIVSYDLDRLTRQPRQLEDLIDAAESGRLQLVTTNGEADLSTDGGRMFARIKVSVAKGEVERKAARQKRANEQAAQAGAWNFPSDPYGYTKLGATKKDRRIVIVPDEAKVVKECYRRYVAGDSLYAIAESLNARGIPASKGGRWSLPRIERMLANPRYAGIVTYKGKRLEGVTPQWEPIIDARLWADYEATKRARRRATSWSTQTRHLLSGLMTCAVCDGPMYARVDHGRDTYACVPGAHAAIAAEDIEPLVVGAVVGRLLDKRVTRELRKTPNIEPLEQEKARAENAWKNVLRLVKDDLLPYAEAQAEARALKTKITRINEQIAAARRESPLTDLAHARKIPARWRKLSTLERRRVLAELGVEIVVDKGKRGRRPTNVHGRPMVDASRVQITFASRDLAVTDVAPESAALAPEIGQAIADAILTATPEDDLTEAILAAVAEAVAS